MTSTTTDTALRDVTRLAVRNEVLRQAWELFATQGFESTTIEQVAEASGMSRRTFFRYFTGKDDLLLSRLVESGDRLVESLHRQPPERTAWDALRAAFQVFVKLQETNQERSRRLQLMLRDEAGVQASIEDRRRRWVANLAPLIEKRLHSSTGSDAPSLTAIAIVGAALTSMEAASLHWAENPGSDLSALVDEAMNAVHPLGPAAGHVTGD
ncbi:TetR family transcriptional regulator [Leifsonia poae]|uniref:TetR family transcriptional regulator n=1 Tax=Leifsonia poae TaxID=110933 RepID=UPI001CC0D014|nr:TetR family transcriptional regulator [Leifsonia poae]